MCFIDVVEIAANIAAVAGSVISACVFKHSIKRERQILTIKTFSKFRQKFPKEIVKMSNDERKDYLREIEFFCLGINNKIYDFDTLRKMSGKRLLSQYKKMKYFVNIRRKERNEDSIGCEYEKVMKRLECYYCTDKKIIQKIFCRKK